MVKSQFFLCEPSGDIARLRFYQVIIIVIFKSLLEALYRSFGVDEACKYSFYFVFKCVYF